LDEKLRVEEEKDFLERIENGSKGYTMEEFNKKSTRFGTISLLMPKRTRKRFMWIIKVVERWSK